MSTQSNTRKLRQGIGLAALSILSGLLLALQFVLSPVAFASPERPAAPSLTPQGVLDLAGVSVVRLVVFYDVNGNVAQCTGLGTLVGSWSPTNLQDNNNWILTDSTLVNLSGETCVATTHGQLTGIQILANTAYTNTPLTTPGTPGATTTTPLVPVLLGQLKCQRQGTTNSCSDTPAESSQAVLESISQLDRSVLFSFHTDANHLQPYLHVVQASIGSQLGIELANPASTTTANAWPSTPVLPGPKPSSQTYLPYLTPKLVGLASNSTKGSSNRGTPGTSLTNPNEPGMPIVDSDGNLMGMSVTGVGTNALTALQISKLSSLQAQHLNTLNSAWDRGITQYEAEDYVGAEATLKQIAGANPQFQAPLVYEGKAAAHIPPGTNGTPTAGQAGGTTQGAVQALGLLGILVIVGIVAGLLLLVLLLVLVSMWARRRQELVRFEAERTAAQHDAELGVQKLQRSKATTNLQQPVTELACPNCGATVYTTDASCPKCHFLLSPSDSGMHLRAAPPQATYVQSLGASVPSISDMPTMEYSPADGSADFEKTIPYSIQQLQGHNLSLAVGHLSDPGIKRKHKPNEDSLFAMQGARTYNAQPQQFGLFVVADGMGGHANGQHASRLAIQTIIDFMLPRISTGSQLDDEAFSNLLLEGVRCANRAVHQRNLEERADMGTTMTAALVVGATAYVANVGDSRTYLYRPPEGLSKITHDHSVVASLVEAGIIKPDDIYTHPKRNQIYRSLGEKATVDVDAFRVPLQPGDKLLLCSDGLWDMVRDPEIQRLLSLPAPDPAQTGKDLIQAALESGGEDNVSVIVVSVTEATSQNGITGIQLLAKPETVTVPDMPLP
jgi:serine/threonine protein phosphatase PrpC